MSIWQGLLLVWTSFALVWWLMAIGLVASRRKPPVDHIAPPNSQFLTIFKALAGPLSEDEYAHLSQCVETFVVDMDSNCELLIGCHVHDQVRWQAFIARMHRCFPGSQLKLVADPNPRRFAANPKVSWMQILAPHASGELWYWSDADIEAPPGTIRSLRSDFDSGNVQFVTSPYAIQITPSAAALLDALFVNLEFYPGVVLLDKLNAIEFGFGSGMLFKAADFRKLVDWNYLGSCLADDYHLGRLLKPVKLGSMRVTTTPAAESWRGALLHYYRWQKTIRWNRPGGFGAQLLVMPVFAWLVALALMPTEAFIWWGLSVALLLDLFAAVSICRLMDCRIGISRLPVIPLWSVIRSVTWVVCWLPLPIVWRGRKWRSAYQKLSASEISGVHKGSRVE